MVARFPEPMKALIPRVLPVVVAILAMLALAAAVAAWRGFRPLSPEEPSGRAAPVPEASDGQGNFAVGQALPQLPAAASAPASGYREIDWQALLPKGWDPLAPFKGLKLEEIEDGDPRAQIALYKARQYWKRAPVERSLDGVPVRLPGFVVSLDAEGEAMREFLLVPYFGACIHVPPPPANQVIHVRTDHPLPALRTMDTVWVSGVMRVESAETMMGYAGYAMHGARVERYLAPAGR